MKKQDSILMGPLLSKFFIDFLSAQKRVSSETIASYRDTWRLLLRYLQDKHSIAPAAARVTDLDVPVVLAFLDHLEQERNNSIRSRNLRLAAIRSFFRLVALTDPLSVNQSARILAIPNKRTDHLLVKALTRDEMEAIVAAPDLKQWNGRRDHALLLTLYNTGARVSEIITLERANIAFGSTTLVDIHGKGRKQRTIPIWTRTAAALRNWFAEPRSSKTSVVFPNSAGNKLSRNGCDYILQQAVTTAATVCPTLSQKHVTPHTVRHSTASHLLQSGVDLSVIALWLGHERLETTHIYVESDLASKQRALNNLPSADPLDSQPLDLPDEVLAFLASL